MRLRGRLLLASTLLVLAPLAVLGGFIRQQTAARLGDQYEARVESIAAGIEDNQRDRNTALRARLRALKRAMGDDNRVRWALGDDPGDGADTGRPGGGVSDDATWLLDYAGRQMELLGLDLLQIQDAEGRILSSGHFRNDYDRVDAETPERLALSADAAALVAGRRPDGPFLAIARVDSLRLGGRMLRLVGGFEIGATTLASLSPDDAVTVHLRHPGGDLWPDGANRVRPSAADGLMRSIAFPAAMPGAGASLGEASLVVAQSLDPMRAVLRGLDLQLAGAWLLVAIGTLAVAARVSAHISRPLESLARQTAELDLDRLDAEFATDRTGEVGDLSRFLDAMTRRLRGSVDRLREAERRATRGEIARQVNHDLRNGITPLRNVLKHLGEVAERSPAELERVWRERHGTLDAGLGYLDDLATQWRRLSTRPDRRPCDLGAIVRQVAAGRMLADGGPVTLDVATPLSAVAADPIGLRRVVENLVANACESRESGAGRVRVSVSTTAPHGEPVVLLAIEDDGPGISPEDVERVFDDFWTTKPGGSGLGLSIVRRLVSDFEGTIRLDSTPGRGTKVEVTFPSAPGGTTPDGTTRTEETNP